MVEIVSVGEAKAHFSKLLARVEKGEKVIVARAGKPAARLVPVRAPKAKREPGSAKGLFTIHDNFDDPLPDDMAEAFGMK